MSPSFAEMARVHVDEMEKLLHLIGTAETRDQLREPQDLFRGIKTRMKAEIAKERDFAVSVEASTYLHSIREAYARVSAISPNTDLRDQERFGAIYSALVDIKFYLSI